MFCACDLPPLHDGWRITFEWHAPCCNLAFLSGLMNESHDVAPGPISRLVRVGNPNVPRHVPALRAVNLVTFSRKPSFRKCGRRQVPTFRQVPPDGYSEKPLDSGAHNAQGREQEHRRARDLDLEEQNDHVATPNAMMPKDTMQAAARRLDLGPSLSQVTPISAAKITEVSRNADTAPKGARVLA